MDVDALHAAFARLGHSPEFLNGLILDMMIRGNADVQCSMEAWLENQREQVFNDEFDQLSNTDVGVLKFLATPDHPLCFSTEGIKHVQALCNGDVVNASRIQTSLNRLAKRGLVGPTGSKGEYEIEDRSHLVFLRDQLHSDAR